MMILGYSCYPIKYERTFLDKILAKPHHIYPFLFITGFCKLERTSSAEYPNKVSPYYSPESRELLAMNFTCIPIQFAKDYKLSL